jgi:hypothetical protein
MFAREPTGAGDIARGEQRVRNQGAGLAVIRCLPVFRLMFNFLQRCFPTGKELRPSNTAWSRSSGG